MTVLLKYQKSTVQFKNRLAPRGMITGASTPAFLPAWMQWVPGEAPFAQGACRTHRIGPQDVAGRVPRMQNKHPTALWELESSPQWCFLTQQLDSASTKDIFKIPTKLHSAGFGPGANNLETSSIGLAGWGKPISLDSWPRYIIPCFQQHRMRKPCINAKDILCIQ